MIGVGDLILSPLSPCHVMEQACPLLRRCPCCADDFPSSRGRRQHQNRCRSEMDPAMVEVQHAHLIHVHRVRRRGRSSG